MYRSSTEVLGSNTVLDGHSRPGWLILPAKKMQGHPEPWKSFHHVRSIPLDFRDQRPSTALLRGTYCRYIRIVCCEICKPRDFTIAYEDDWLSSLNDLCCFRTVELFKEDNETRRSTLTQPSRLQSLCGLGCCLIMSNLIGSGGRKINEVRLCHMASVPPTLVKQASDHLPRLSTLSLMRH